MIAELKAENTRLRALLDAVIPSPESGAESVSGAELLLRMQEALRPFGKWAAMFKASPDEEHLGTKWNEWNEEVVDTCTPTVGDLRCAAALALSPPATGAKPEEE